MTAIFIAHRLEPQRFPAQRRNDLILQLQLRLQPALEGVARKIRPADAVVAHLVREHGPNSAPRCAGRARAFGFFIQAVQNFMIRHDQMRARRDPQPPVHVHARPVQHFDLFDQDRRVHDHAAADQADSVPRKNPRRREMNLERPKLVDDRMPGVIPAVEARHIIRALRQKIHRLALALVAPLRTDHCDHAHCSSMSLRVRRAKQPSVIKRLLRRYRSS